MSNNLINEKLDNYCNWKSVRFLQIIRCPAIIKHQVTLSCQLANWGSIEFLDWLRKFTTEATNIFDKEKQYFAIVNRNSQSGKSTLLIEFLYGQKNKSLFNVCTAIVKFLSLMTRHWSWNKSWVDLTLLTLILQRLAVDILTLNKWTLQDSFQVVILVDLKIKENLFEV